MPSCSSSGVDKLDIFRIVDSSLQKEDSRMRCQFNKAAAYVNDLFMAMANYDIRFLFDPMSLDDCRCEMMSSNEINLLCTLKEVPIDSCILKGEVTRGAVMIEVAEDYTTRLDMASWDDVITEASSGRRYISPSKILQALLDVIQRSIHEISRENNEPTILCRFSGDQLSIMVKLDPTRVFWINLIPTIRMRRYVGPLVEFDRRFQNVFKSLRLNDTTVDSVCLVAKPYGADQELLWRITFNDVENRMFNSKQFLCARHCLYVMDRLCAKLSPFNGTGTHLLRYHFQTLILREFGTHPRSKSWAPKKFNSRLKGTLASLCVSLREKKCLNVFTDVNIFSYLDAETLKILAAKLSKFNLDAKHISSLL